MFLFGQLVWTEWCRWIRMLMKMVDFLVKVELIIVWLLNLTSNDVSFRINLLVGYKTIEVRIIKACERIRSEGIFSQPSFYVRLKNLAPKYLLFLFFFFFSPFFSFTHFLFFFWIFNSFTNSPLYINFKSLRCLLFFLVLKLMWYKGRI